MSTFLRTIVPAYFYPSGAGLTRWNSLNAAAASIDVVAIGNPGSGPGASADANYTSAFNALIAAGGTVIGYVYTSYGARASGDVEADIDDWVSFYPMIQGIFFDEHEDNDLGDLAYYQGLYTYVRNAIPGALVVGNPGVSGLAEGYVSGTPTADVYVIYENDGSPALSVPSYSASYPRTRFAALLHTASSSDMTAFLADCRINNVGYAYATDDVMANPWDTLPSYWTDEVAEIRAHNHTRRRASSY